jgi:hypothetical protein
LEKCFSSKTQNARHFCASIKSLRVVKTWHLLFNGNWMCCLRICLMIFGELKYKKEACGFPAEGVVAATL